MSTNNRVRIVLPEGVENNPDLPFCAHGTKVFIGDTGVKNLTNIIVTYPVDGAVQIDLTILASGGDVGLDYDATADVEVTSKIHPWEQFLKSRKAAIDWMLENGDKIDSIVKAVSLDEGQARLIAATPKERLD